MQREIKFRGKCKISGDWVFGDLIHGVGVKEGRVYILPRKVNLAHVKHCDPLDGVEVLPESVGQFTGLPDKAGKEIYEGDILELIGGTCDFLPCGVYDDQRHEVGSLLAVQVLPSGFTLCLLRQKDCDIPNVVGKVDNYTFWNHARSLEIIGNIYEHPQLLNK